MDGVFRASIGNLGTQFGPKRLNSAWFLTQSALWRSESACRYVWPQFGLKFGFGRVLACLTRTVVEMLKSRAISLTLATHRTAPKLEFQ